MVYKVKDNEFSTTDINNTESKSGIQFQNKSINKSNSNIKKEEDNNNDKDKKERN